MSNIQMERVIGDAEQDDIRAQVREVMSSSGMSQADVARESGLADSTFSGWLAGTYKGVSSDKAAKVLRWLEGRSKRVSAAEILAAPPKFVLTPTAEKFFATLGYAQMAADVVCITGGAGVGKTTALEEYQRLNPNVWIVTAEPTTASPHNILVEIADTLGVLEKGASRLSNVIKNRIRGTRGLLIIDEAQHLGVPALDQVRSLHDLAKVGLAFVGNEGVYTSLIGERKAGKVAQISSRVSASATRASPLQRDISMVIDAWDVRDKESVATLRAIAKKPGALRGVVKTLRMAHMISAGKGEAINVSHIRQAWSQLLSTPLQMEP